MNPASKGNDSAQAHASHAMSIDDAYRVQRTLARSARCITELVTIDGAGPFIRKKIPKRLAHRAVWATLGDCSAPGLPRIQATYETPDWFMVVHDYLPGKTLEDAIDEQDRMAPIEAVAIIESLCGTVADLHAHGIIHRDISPSNVVILENDAGATGRPRARLIDFGNARMTFEPASRDDSAQGTWGFAAPEQHGFADADARSDIYSLGRLLGFMLTGARPGDSEDETYHQRLSDPGIVPPHLRTIVERACAFDRTARYQTAEELAQAAREAIKEGTEVQAAHAAHAPLESPDSNRHGSSDQSAQGTCPTGDVRQTQNTSGSSQNPQPSKSPRHLQAQRSGNRAVQFALLGIVFVAAVAIGAVSIISALQPKDTPSGNNAPASSSNEMDDVTDNMADSLLDIAFKSSTGGNLNASQEAADIQLELVESGWSPSSSGYINYAFAIRNPSDSETVDFPEVIITGRSSDGSVVFSQSQVLSSIGPEETLYFGAPAGNGTAPTSVEFALGTPNDYNITDSEGTRPTFTFSPVKEVDSGLGSISFTGEMTMSEGAIPEFASNVTIVIVLRDESGSIIYGGSTCVGIPEPGQSVPFECGSYNVPDYATVEAHALLW